MAKISAAEFQKHFGKYRDLAQREPVAGVEHCALIKIGAKVVRHARYVTFQMAEVAVPAACSTTFCDA